MCMVTQPLWDRVVVWVSALFGPVCYNQLKIIIEIFKAKAVADSRTQNKYVEEEANLPTFKLESIKLSALIDAYEK